MRWKVSRLRSKGSGEKKTCGVCSITRLVSLKNQPMHTCRKERVGMWSQSKMAMYSECVTWSAALMLPALAWWLLSRMR